MAVSPTGGGRYPCEVRGIWIVVLAVRLATDQIGEAVVVTVICVAQGAALQLLIICVFLTRRPSVS